MHRRARKVVATLVAWLLLAGPATAAHDTLTIGTVQFPPDMHPNITATAIKDFILAAGLRTMVAYNRDGTVRCVLCTEVPTLANGRAKLTERPGGTRAMTVDYTLKPGLTWADGVKLTARDFVFGWTVAKAFAPPESTEAVEAVSDDVVRVVLREVRYDFDRQIFYPLPEHIEGQVFAEAKDPLDYGQHSAYNRAPETPGLWMGPYRITQFTPNQTVTLAPNPYWPGPKPAFREVQMRLVGNDAALQANLLAGDVQAVAPGMLGLTLDQILGLSKGRDASRFTVSFLPQPGSYEHFALNLDNKLLADPRVRRAMSMAVDRASITGRLFASKVDPALSFLHPSQAPWDPSTPTWPYDPAKAKALLAEAGFKPGADGILVSPEGERFSLDYVTTAGNRMRELVQQVLQSSFKAVGIELVIRNQPPRVMFGDSLRRRQFGGIVQFQTDMPLDFVPSIYFESRYVPTEANNWTGLNYSGLHDPQMDTALQAARTELDPQKRHELWKLILDRYAEQMPEIPLFFTVSATIVPVWLTGVADARRYGVATGWIEEWGVKE